MNRFWRDKAACLNVVQRGDDPFYGYDHDQEEEAKQFCAQCPVSAECLETARGLGDRWGIWGGKTSDERERREAPLPVKVSPAHEQRVLDWVARNPGKPRFCTHGHEYTVANTIFAAKRGYEYRRCRQCARESVRKAKQRREREARRVGRAS